MKRVGLHILFWIVILFWSSTIYDYNGKYSWAFVELMAIRLPLIIAATYLISHYLLIEFLLKKKQYLKFALLALGVFIIANLIDRVIIGTPLVHHVLKDLDLTYSFFNRIPILRNSFLLLSIISLATGIKFYKYLIEKERRTHALQKENLSIKLSLLKSQINPHFTFNALNNLYSIATQNNDKDAAEGIHHLSQIMKYLTYESDVDLVPLSREVDIIQSYIYIQYLRIDEDDDTTITFQNKVDSEKKIPPVLLLPLIENAFKHGINVHQPSSVHIELHTDQDDLSIHIKNTAFPKNSSSDSGGKGIINLQNRLEILFPNLHTFTHGIEGNHYITYLKIPLS